MIFQFNISIDDIHPPIWRRLQVPGDITLFKFHFIIQIAMGWTNSHLHEFYIDDYIYGTLFEDDWEPREIRPEKDFLLEQVIQDQGFKFAYLYDFGDSWRHTILVEDIVEPSPGQYYPTCLDGARACPPEDVGGTWGYEEFLAAIADLHHPEHNNYLTWVGGDYDPEAFDRNRTDEDLKNVGRSDLVRIYHRYHGTQLGPELKLYQGVSQWLEALTPEERIQLDELPLRRDAVSLLLYLREHRITGTQSTGNLPLKAIRAVVPTFVVPPALETKIGDRVYKIRSENDLWPVYFIHTLLEVGELLTGGPGRRLRLTAKGEQFLEEETPLQVWFMLETWWHHINWLIAFPFAGMGEQLPYNFTLSVLDHLVLLPLDKPHPFVDFADRIIQTTGLQWHAQNTTRARDSLHQAVERTVISILESFGAVERQEQEENIDGFSFPQLQTFTITKLGGGLLKAIAGGPF